MAPETKQGAAPPRDRPAFAADQAQAYCGPPGRYGLSLLPARYGLRPHWEMSISARCSVPAAMVLAVGAAMRETRQLRSLYTWLG